MKYKVYFEVMTQYCVTVDANSPEAAVRLVKFDPHSALSDRETVQGASGLVGDAIAVPHHEQVE